MTMWRLLLAVALAGATLAPAAQAQRAARGASTFEDAPIVSPGQFKDRIAAGETLFYAVDVEEGRRLSVGVKMGAAGERVPVEVHLRLYNAERTEDVFAHEPALSGGKNSLRLRSRGGTVGLSPDYPDPGRHYFSVSVEFAGPRIAESYELEVDVAVEEGPAGGAIAASPSPGRGEQRPADEPSRWGAYLKAFLLGLIGGALIITGWLAIRGPARELRPL